MLTELKTFLENRLRALSPTLDLESGSPAQIYVIEPVLKYLGTDPLETDLTKFVGDRLSQAYPDLYADNPGAIHDLFVKPLLLLLEPLKREIAGIKRDSSLRDATVLSDDAADALVANVFEERPDAGRASGIARMFFSNPSNQHVEITTRFFTTSGLGFLPTAPMTISAEEMVFNRIGNLYFMDVPVQAESEGDAYNIEVDSLAGVSGIFGVVRVSNPWRFENGSPKIDTPTFVAQARESLSERSLVTRRGGSAIARSAFRGSLRAVQIIGAGDDEMQRDILVAQSPGHAWLSGTVGIYGNLAFVQAETVDDTSTLPTVGVGDEVLIYLGKTEFPALTGNRTRRLRVEEVLLGPVVSTDPAVPVSFLVRWADPRGTLPSLGGNTTFRGGLSKKGTVKISSLPSVGAVDDEVPNQAVHVLGHTDYYVRPVLQQTSKVVLNGLTDDPGGRSFRLQRSTLTTAAGSNIVEDSVDFKGLDVRPGDYLVIETGADIGTYVVRRVDPVSGGVGKLYLNSNLSTSATGSIRYCILKGIDINPFSPKIPKLPFGDMACTDLQTVIGSDIFNFTDATSDLPGYGVRVGDTIRVKSGFDVGSFTILAFVDSKHVQVDRAAGASGSSLGYEIFTPLERVELPLVRLREMTLLDSSKQATGVSIPPADPVAITPLADMTSAQVRGRSQRRTGFVLPDLGEILSPLPSAAGSTASVPAGRFSSGLDVSRGAYGPVSSFLLTDEFDYVAEFFGRCSHFIVTAEDTGSSENFPPIDPKPGDSLTIKSGPNKGSYLIKKVTKVRYQVDDSGPESHWAYAIEIYGQFPVDVFKHVFEFLQNTATAKSVNCAVDPVDFRTEVALPDVFTQIWNSLPTKFTTALAAYGLQNVPGIETFLEGLLLTDYEWGDPARGVLRSYFLAPVLFQQNTASHDNPTLYSLRTAGGTVLKFRADPSRYQRHLLVPSRLTGDASVSAYPRDLDPSTPGSAIFSTASRPTLFNQGIQSGDVLSVHEERFFHGSTGAAGTAPGDLMTAVVTTENSTTVVFPNNATPFDEEIVGNILHIEEGADRGAYTVTRRIDGKTLVLDRPLTSSTPIIHARGLVAAWGIETGKSVIESQEPLFVDTANFSFVGKYITLFGVDSKFQGSYAIKSIISSSKVEVDRDAFGTAWPAVGSEFSGVGFWAVTDAAEPEKTGSPTTGTTLLAVRPVRVYEDTPTDYVINTVEPSPSTSMATLASGVVKMGVKQPFCIYRRNLRRVNPTEMDAKREGPLYYFDTEVVSLGCQEANNIPKASYLEADPATYESVGYRHIVDDFTLTYSMRESGTLRLPGAVLPLNAPDSPENLVPLSGTPAQITYERGDLVARMQEFLDSASDRVASANMLARHMLPAYVSYDATYVGGSAPGVVAKDVINYIENLAVEQPMDVSEIQDLIRQRGGNLRTPSQAIVTLHDWDRRVWAEFSEDQLGGSLTLVPYHGTPRITALAAGPDYSGKDPMPAGERINLVRR